MNKSNQITNPTPARRSNVERSQNTRSKIIDAAIYCLRHYGYEGTSIYLVAEKAGISKGAAQHQYPSKTDLMLAVAEHSLSVQSEYRTKMVKKIKSSTHAEWFSELAEISWALAKKPYYIALIEIMMATRNDKALKKRFAPLNRRIDELQALAAERIATKLGIKPSPSIAGLVQMHNTMVRGLAIGFMYTHNPKGLRAGFDAQKESERLLLENALASGTST